MSDKTFEAELRETLEDSEHTLPPEVLERLAAARRQAVAEVTEPSPAAGRRWLGPLLGAAACVALALGIVLRSGVPDGGTAPALVEAHVPFEDDGFSAAQEMELLEDLEFFAWVMEQEAIRVDEGATDAG